MKRQTKVILGVIILVISFFIIKSIFFDKSPKEQIFEIVNNNSQTLISNIDRQEFSDSLAIRGIEDINIIGESVDFYCGGKGIAPSSQDYGFYYTEDDLPKAIWCGVKYCDDSLLVDDGDGHSTDFQYKY